MALVGCNLEKKSSRQTGTSWDLLNSQKPFGLCLMNCWIASPRTPSIPIAVCLANGVAVNPEEDGYLPIGQDVRRVWDWSWGSRGLHRQER